MSRLDGLVFDKDGTLFDFAATWDAWSQAFIKRVAKGDMGQAERIGAAIGVDMEQGRILPGSIVVAGTPVEIAEALAPFLPDMSDAELLHVLNEEAACAPQVQAVPLAPLLDRFRQAGLRLGVATNDSEAPALAHLDAAGVRGRFDFIAGSDSGFGGKPEPGQLLAFCDATGLAPARCAMVGDSLHDLHAGRAAGMVTVGVLTGYADREELSPVADVVLPDIGQLPDWLALR